jgi:hypothetical protein
VGQSFIQRRDKDKSFLVGRSHNSMEKTKKRLATENCLPTMKYGGGKIVIWGWISSKGVGRLVFIEGIMEKYQYKRILVENLASSCDILGLSDNFVFQQDNDPKHKSKYVRDFF